MEKKIETEMEGLREERFSGRGMENESEGVETIGGDGSKTGLVMKKGENKSSTSIGASLTWTTGKKRRATTITNLSTWVSLCYANPMPWILATCRHYIACGCVRAHGTTNQMVSSTRPEAEILGTRVKF